MKILALDSSAVSASACILEDGNILAEDYVNIRQTHSQTLMVMVQHVLEITGTCLSDVDVLAVSAGPGSFTGVRIGVACVKGMAMAQKKPCVGVSTLEAMAAQMRDHNGIVCAVMDARCQQVYNALFDINEGQVHRITEDRALSIEALKEELETHYQHVWLVGDGAELCYQQYGFAAFSTLAPAALLYQRASGVALAAAEHSGVDAAQLQPVYLRLPQAERELKAKQAKEKGK